MMNPDINTSGKRFEPNPEVGGGLFALNIADGKLRWQAKPAPCGKREGCSPAQSQAVTAIPGVVFSGSLDGHFRAYSAKDGSVIWDFDTVRNFETVNGVAAKGGAMDAAGPVIAGGLLLVNSGYGNWGGMPGNVLIAFTVDGK
jgi:polyvinyl alcohol dehydrogenase (cytochrome)